MHIIINLIKQMTGRKRAGRKQSMPCNTIKVSKNSVGMQKLVLRAWTRKEKPHQPIRYKQDTHLITIIFHCSMLAASSLITKGMLKYKIEG
jgi:hypothetical protein